MARPTYTDLILFRTPTSGTEGLSQTNLNNIITLLFKDLFRIFAKGQYSTYVTLANHPSLDTIDVYSVIIRRATVIGNAWMTQVWNMRDDTNTIARIPELRLTTEDIEDVATILNVGIKREFVNRYEEIFTIDPYSHNNNHDMEVL